MTLAIVLIVLVRLASPFTRIARGRAELGRRPNMLTASDPNLPIEASQE